MQADLQAQSATHTKLKQIFRCSTYNNSNRLSASERPTEIRTQNENCIEKISSSSRFPFRRWKFWKRFLACPGLVRSMHKRTCRKASRSLSLLGTFNRLKFISSIFPMLWNHYGIRCWTLHQNGTGDCHFKSMHGEYTQDESFMCIAIVLVLSILSISRLRIKLCELIAPFSWRYAFYGKRIILLGGRKIDRCILFK